MTSALTSVLTSALSTVLPAPTTISSPPPSHCAQVSCLQADNEYLQEQLDEGGGGGGGAKARIAALEQQLKDGKGGAEVQRLEAALLGKSSRVAVLEEQLLQNARAFAKQLSVLKTQLMEAEAMAGGGFGSPANMLDEFPARYSPSPNLFAQGGSGSSRPGSASLLSLGFSDGDASFGRRPSSGGFLSSSRASRAQSSSGRDLEPLWP